MHRSYNIFFLLLGRSTKHSIYLFLLKSHCGPTSHNICPPHAGEDVFLISSSTSRSRSRIPRKGHDKGKKHEQNIPWVSLWSLDVKGEEPPHIGCGRMEGRQMARTHTHAGRHSVLRRIADNWRVMLSRSLADRCQSFCFKSRGYALLCFSFHTSQLIQCLAQRVQSAGEYQWPFKAHLSVIFPF